MALLTGLTPDGQEVPVQVKPDGRLVAEGLSGPQGVEGPAGPAGDSQWVKNGADINYTAGRVLVGTSTSFTALLGAGLQVHGTGALAYVNSGRWSNNTAFSEYIFSKSRGANVGTRAIVQSGDGLGGIQFTGDDGTSFVSAASITVTVDGTPGANDMPGRLVFSTTADGASSPTERMRIKASGVINIAATTVFADNTAARAGGLVAGDIYRKTDGTLMITFSP